MMVTQETQEFLDTGSDFLKDNSHTFCVLVLLMVIDVIVVYFQLVSHEVPLPLLLYSMS
jgi:hypothetical protein